MDRDAMLLGLFDGLSDRGPSYPRDGSLESKAYHAMRTEASGNRRLRRSFQDGFDDSMRGDYPAASGLTDDELLAYSLGNLKFRMLGEAGRLHKTSGGTYLMMIDCENPNKHRPRSYGEESLMLLNGIENIMLHGDGDIT